MASSSKTHPGIEPAIKRLKQGLMTHNGKLAFSAHLDLFHIGARVAPRLISELDLIDLGDADHSEAASLAVGLAVLLHDIDEAIAVQYIEKALQGECTPSIAGGFKAIIAEGKTRYWKTVAHGVIILEQFGISRSHRPSRHVAKWLARVPKQRLEGITRLFIVPQKSTDTDLGNYMPHVHVVTVRWRTGLFATYLTPWITNLLHEFVLYHEIGHFHHRHDFGQDPEQEDQANSFAGALFKKNHPFVSSFAKVVGKAFGFVFRKIFTLSKNRRLAKRLREKGNRNTD